MHIREFAKYVRERTYLFHQVHHPISQWISFIAGEVGELANWNNKFVRGMIPYEEMKREAAKEIADNIIYSICLAEELQLDIEKVLIDKFNEVSKRHNMHIHIEDETSDFKYFYPDYFAPLRKKLSGEVGE